MISRAQIEVLKFIKSRLRVGILRLLINFSIQPRNPDHALSLNQSSTFRYDVNQLIGAIELVVNK